MKPHLIGIAGPSCAGKGEIANWLKRRLDAVILDLDGYYLDQRQIPLAERAALNYDVPSALDTDLLFDQVRRVAAGETVEKPVYSFARHTREESTFRFVPGAYVIIEGLFPLHWPEVRENLGTRVFVDAPDAECLRRRILRDTMYRGRQEEAIKRQFREQVQPAADLYVRPSKAFADLVLDGERPWEENGERVLAWVRRATAPAT